MNGLTRTEDRLRMANPIPDPADPPVTTKTAAAVLLDLEKRRGTMQTQKTTREGAPTGAPPLRRWNGPLVGAAAFAAVIAVGAGVLLASSGDNDPEVDAAPVASVTTQAPATTVAPPTTAAAVTTPPAAAFTAEDALAVKDAYFAEYNAGNADAVIALFEPSASFTTNLGQLTRASWELLMVWNAAQGTAVSSADCEVREEVDGVSVTLHCPHDNLDALVQAVDAPPVPIAFTLVITADGISEWRHMFGTPNFNNVDNPFMIWMAAHHREARNSVTFGTWTSIEEAEENALQRVRYADEWAAYLTENGCEYDDGC